MRRTIYGLCDKLQKRRREGNAFAAKLLRHIVYPAQQRSSYQTITEDHPMNAPRQAQARPLPDIENDHRVAALAKVTQMHDDLISANAAIQQYRIDLNREHDRVQMMVEERDRYRHESLRLHKMLVELTTQMANIGLLTRRAEDFVASVNELDRAPTPTTAALDELAADLGTKQLEKVHD
jgi:uncharacterized coiled-coil DUF342 family protein